MPGISSADCLFADMCIDPGSSGSQSFEATDFLIYGRRFGVSSHLILWQVGFIGATGHVSNYNNKNAIKKLSDYLQCHYGLDHLVALYEAAQYPTFNPKISWVSVSMLASVDVPRISTLYVPPLNKKNYDVNMFKELGMLD